MHKKKIIYILGVIVLIFLIILAVFLRRNEEQKTNTNKIEATVMVINDDTITIQDTKDVIYTFSTDKIIANVGQDISIIYTGILDEYEQMQNVEVVSYEIMVNSNNDFPVTWQDNGIFSDYYNYAYNKLKTMSLDEKIAQLLLVRLPDNPKEALKEYQFGGYIFFEKDFRDKTKEQVKTMIKELQDISKIPLLTAVDEEGGNVIRVSSNPNLVSEPFKSSQELYNQGGMPSISKDTIQKSEVLYNLGLNLNLAPVVDVSTNSSDYIYPRTIGQNTDITSTYAKTVISASKSGKVSYTLKHFPGYGNNLDTHTGASIDNRTLEEIRQNDLPPFESGIKAGAEAVLVNHNTMSNIDSNNPASLSSTVHNILRNDLNFSGVIITDNTDMSALNSISKVNVKALLSGNNMIITTDYETSMNEIKKAVNDNEISQNLIDELAFKVIAWKYYKGLIIENQK